jgi:mono/diheme cytochrome c family protein
MSFVGRLLFSRTRNWKSGVPFLELAEWNSRLKVRLGKPIEMKLSFLCLALAVPVVSARAAAPVDYVRDVKPVFAEHCYGCHGASQQKSGLRMDTVTFALKGGENGPALKPGRSVDSLLVQAVKGTHSDISRMPYKKPPLTDAQIALIEHWINEGAKAPANEQPQKDSHWAFVAPARLPSPVVKQTAWPRNPIDHFILARLEEEGIQPSPEADRVTLIRRLSLDLTGLPPAITDVDAFVNDRRPDAYEDLVERLLASPHYGERWGRHWLDVARYADSNGYSIDAPRSIWKYRDWVIGALNSDLPFDRFVIEQLAGDLHPSATLEQKIATGFNRNTQINQEGGIDPEQFRVESVIDRVNTTATAFLGLTVGCAQCHDHKFDPISQREYYQFYAFFNNTLEDGHGKSAPEGMLEIPGETEAMENLQKELEEAEADLGRYLDTKGSDVVKWEQSLTAEEAGKLKADVQNVLKIPFAERTAQQKRVVYGVFRGDDSEFKQRNAKLARLEKRQPKPVTTLVMVEREEPRESFVFIKGDFTRKGPVVTPGVPAVLNPLVAVASESEAAPAAARSELPNNASTLQPRHEPNPLTPSLSRGGGEGARLVRRSLGEGGRAGEGVVQGFKARTSGSADPLPGAADEVSAKDGNSLGRGEGEPTSNSLLKEKAPKSDPHSPQPNRLDLARWIVDPQNPLAARVMVNRIWQQYFGRGIVETENDFGTQGSLPSHPELLDWLACEFMAPSVPVESLNRSSVPSPADSTIQRFNDSTAQAWSLKHIHRLIVNSATYRQSSRVRPDLAVIDPNNKLLARQSRLRLDAEVVRDVCLSASGLLNDKMGGPSVFPPQPDGVMKLGQVKRDWKASAGADRFRRGLYTHFWRATPHPALAVFDAADGFSTCTRRIRSNTPLQALTLLNDEAFVEFAQALATRVLKEGPTTDASRMDFAFRVCLSRPPVPDEKQRLLDLLDKDLLALRKSSAEAVAILGRKGDSKADVKRLAAWTTVARVLLNLDETITRE